MRLGVTLRLLIPTLGILVGSNSNHVYAAECEGQDLYVPYPFDATTFDKYRVCFSETGDSKVYDCPPYLKFSETTRSCTGSSADHPIGICTKAGEQFKDPLDNECTEYYKCDEELYQILDSCTKTNGYFNPLLRECVSKTEYYCEDDFPDCSKSKYQNRKWVDRESCEFFYECDGDVIVSLKCPSGMYFDAHTQSCLYNIDDACKDPKSMTDWNIETICEGKVGKFLPDPNYCKAYYYCVDESTPYWQYCSDDRYFSNGSCTKTRPSNCICEDEDWATNGKSSVNVPHPDNTKFYVCREGRQPEEKSCPAGTTFNATKKMCSA